MNISTLERRFAFDNISNLFQLQVTGYDHKFIQVQFNETHHIVQKRR